MTPTNSTQGIKSVSAAGVRCGQGARMRSSNEPCLHLGRTLLPTPFPLKPVCLACADLLSFQAHV